MSGRLIDWAGEAAHGGWLAPSKTSMMNMWPWFLLTAYLSNSPGAAQIIQFSGASLVPPAAQTAGFNLQTFNSTFAPSKFDTAETYPSRDEWYIANYSGWGPGSSAGLTFNSDRSLTIEGNGALNGQIGTAGINGASWVGTAFGGGAYFEATAKFNPALVNITNGWPAFWSMAIEHLGNSGGPQWVGQAANYSHFSEVDIFEYDTFGFGGANTYGGNINDWYGIYNVTCTGLCGVSTSPGVRYGPAGMDWTQYHKLGLLWIPATVSVDGSVTFYLDDQPVGTQSWAQFTGQNPPPGGAAAWTYGILDSQHLVLILGSGISQPFTLQSVKVWQASAAGNLVQ